MQKCSIATAEGCCCWLVTRGQGHVKCRPRRHSQDKLNYILNIRSLRCMVYIGICVCMYVCMRAYRTLLSHYEYASKAQKAAHSPYRTNNSGLSPQRPCVCGGARWKAFGGKWGSHIHAFGCRHAFHLLEIEWFMGANMPHRLFIPLKSANLQAFIIITFSFICQWVGVYAKNGASFAH